MKISQIFLARSRAFFLIICIVFGCFLYYSVKNERVYVRYTAHPRLISADELQWVVENRDDTDTIRCEGYSFLQGIIQPVGGGGKPILIRTVEEIVEIAPGERVEESIPLNLAPGKYQFVLNVTGDHGVNGTYRVTKRID